MASPEQRTVPEAGALTVEHVTNSLGQIESWIGAIRLALGGLSPETPLAFAQDLTLLPAVPPLRVHNDCPPPPPPPKPTPKGGHKPKKPATKK